MSHYDTLGVPRDATQDEIKQAYRRRASGAHPDKGGSTDDMQAINRAHEVLSDPERRAEYDRTGSDAEVAPMEEVARGMLLDLFRKLLDGDCNDILGEAKTLILLHRGRQHTEIVRAHHKRSRLVKRSKKVRVKKGENLVQMLIDQQIKHIDETIPEMERSLGLYDLCTTMLTNYEQDAEPAKTNQPEVFGGLLGTGIWRG